MSLADELAAVVAKFADGGRPVAQRPTGVTAHPVTSHLPPPAAHRVSLKSSGAEIPLSATGCAPAPDDQLALGLSSHRRVSAFPHPVRDGFVVVIDHSAAFIDENEALALRDVLIEGLAHTPERKDIR